MPMRDVIYEISRKRLGVAVVRGGDGRVAGIITDGDLRRLLERHGGDLLVKTAGECAFPNPATVSPDLLAAEALATLEKRKITSLVVADADGKLQGVLHLHDLWGIQLI
jgi:arabinose-5-phosphate isomerase